jgi:hypothetical protein
MPASTIVVRPARFSDVAAIESFVERYVPCPRLGFDTRSAFHRSCRPPPSGFAHRTIPPFRPFPRPDSTRSTATSLYGTFDVPRLVERAVVAVVAVHGGTTVGFLAVGSRAPMPDTSGVRGHHDASDKLQWAKQAALDVGHVPVSEGGPAGATLWLHGCATSPSLQDPKSVVLQMMNLCFERAPWNPTSVLAATDSLVEKTAVGALMEKKKIMPNGNGDDASSAKRFALYEVTRSQTAPAAVSRRATLEDYDDFLVLAAHVASVAAADTPGGTKIGGFEGVEGVNLSSSTHETTRSPCVVQNAMANMVQESLKAPEGSAAVLVAVFRDTIVALVAVTNASMESFVDDFAGTHDLSVYDEFKKPVEVVVEEVDIEKGNDEHEADDDESDAAAPIATQLAELAVGAEDDEDAEHVSEKKNSASVVTETPGGSDAFRVTAFAVLPGWETRIDSLYDAAFAAFPKNDFCVLSTPCASKEVPFFTRTAVRVPLKPGFVSFAEQTVVMRHRYAVCDGFVVRVGTKEDVRGVTDLLAGTSNREKKAHAFHKRVAESETETRERTASTGSAFVACCDGQVVGYLLFDLAVDVDVLRRAFRVDLLTREFSQTNEFCELVAYELNPVFAFRARRVGFVAEALRVSGKHVAVYKHGLEDDFGLNAADPENLDVEESQLNKLPDAVARDFAMATPKTGPNAERVSFALFVLTSRIAANVRTVVDARVVVLGGDDAALAAVEFLATHACVKFENLVLIAPFGGLFPDGVPNHAHHQCHQSLFAKLGLGQHGVVGYHEADLVRLQRRGVGDTPGGSTDRGGGVVFFHDSSEFVFDALALCLTPRDETRRAVLGDDVEADERLREVPVERFCDFVANVSNMDQGERNHITENGDGLVLVYGATLVSIGAVLKLMNIGVAPERILRVVPETEETEGEEEIEHKRFQSTAAYAERVVRCTLGDDALTFPGLPPPLRGVQLAGCEGVELKNGQPGVRCYFQEFVMTGDDTTNTDGKEHQPRGVKAVDAFVMLGCDEPDLDPKTFMCLDQAGLVLDGGLVVDGMFRTNDERIYAAGDCAKFSKRIKGGPGSANFTKHPQKRAMRTRDARECGFLLANSLVRQFVTNWDDENDKEQSSSSSFSLTTPAFRNPRVESAAFPGGAFFFRASLVSISHPPHSAD